MADAEQPDPSSPPLVRLVLVRHGETAWARAGRHTGRTDVPLTDLGREQAGVLGARLRGRSSDRVATSPLARAAETCRLAGLGDGAEVWDDLVEWDYGAYEGRTSAEIRREVPGWTVWRDGVPGGETAEQVGARADRVIARAVGPARPGARPEASREVVLFAHGHLLRVLAARWLGLPPEGGRLLALSPATLSVLGHEREQRVLVRWNDRCHLVLPSHVWSERDDPEG